MPGAKTGAPRGRHFERENGHHFSPIMYNTTFQIFFWVGESDSDIIFTIWHKGHPHSGEKVRISVNGIVIIHLFTHITLYGFSAIVN